MLSSSLAAVLARRNIHYGWVVVAVTFLTMLVTAGAMGAPGVLDRAAGTRVRLGQCPDFHGAGASVAAVRLVRPVRGGVHEPVRAAPRHDRCGRVGDRRSHDLAGDDAGVAADRVVGVRGRYRHRPDCGRPGRHRGGALVHVSPRSCGRPAHGEQRDRSTGVPAADRRTHRTLRLAAGADLCLRYPGCLLRWWRSR